MIYQHVLHLGVLGVLLVGTLAEFIKEEEENIWNIIQWFIRNIKLYYIILYIRESYGMFYFSLNNMILCLDIKRVDLHVYKCIWGKSHFSLQFFLVMNN